MTMTKNRPVGFVTTQVLTVASSSAVLGITTFLSAQSGAEVVAEVPVDTHAVAEISGSQGPSFHPLTGLPNLVTSPPLEIAPITGPSSASNPPSSPAPASAPTTPAPAPVAESAPTPAPAPEPAPAPPPAPAPTPAPVDAVSSGS
jgi:hypothetical protein